MTKALMLLNLVANRPGLTLTEVSKQAEAPAATTHRPLHTLRKPGLVRVEHQPVGAVSVSAPAERMSDQRPDEVVAAVVAARRVAAGLHYHQGAGQ